MDGTAAIVGVGLAASCGFRVFVPMLVASLASYFGYLEVSDGFAWIGSRPAILAFAVATLMELVAYYVPWLDNLLDSIASPSAVVAGVLLFAASAVDFDPFLRWSLAAMAGGGSAAVVQGGSVATRLASTATTGGFGNAAVSTIEAIAGFFFPVLSIVVPMLSLILLLVTVGCMYFIGRSVLRRLFRRQSPEATRT